MRSSTISSLATLGVVAAAYDLPANLKAIYNNHKVVAAHATN
jgi:hypothetical protein